MSIFRKLGRAINEPKTAYSPPTDSAVSEMAKSLLKAAVMADSKGDFSDALVLYKQSLDKWFEILHAETDPGSS